MQTEVHFSSNSDDWATPQPFVDALARWLGWKFTLDPCASKGNAKAPLYFTEETDGLSQTWHGQVFMNPPYSEIGTWMEKAAAENAAGTAIACLVPARTDTKWFHLVASEADEIIFLKGRLKFGDGKNSAPFPSAVIVFAGEVFSEQMIIFKDWRTW